MSLRTLVFSILCGIAYSASGTTPPYIPPERAAAFDEPGTAAQPAGSCGAA